jgi:hypothetical protein
MAGGDTSTVWSESPQGWTDAIRRGSEVVTNKSLHRLAVAVSAALVAAGCADTGGGATSRKDDMLLSAGFVSKKADATARMAALKSLPPHQFVVRNRDGRTVYLYADPTVCGCVYVGDQNAYDQYRMAARQTATDEQIRAILSTAPLPGEEGLL